MIIQPKKKRVESSLRPQESRYKNYYYNHHQLSLTYQHRCCRASSPPTSALLRCVDDQENAEIPLHRRLCVETSHNLDNMSLYYINFTLYKYFNPQSIYLIFSFLFRPLIITTIS